MNNSDYFQVGKLYQCSLQGLGLYLDKEQSTHIGCLTVSTIMVIEINDNNNIKILSNDKVGWFCCPQWGYEKYFKQIGESTDI